MILIDGHPVRDKAKKDYEKAKRDLERARGDLDRFNGEDKPAYTRWLHRNFGQLLTRLREREQALHHKQALVREIETVAVFECLSHKEAYEQVMWRREQEESLGREDGSNRDDEEDEDEDRDPSGQADASDADSDPDADARDHEFNDIFEEFEQAFREFFGFDSDSAHDRRKASRSAPEKDRRVKDLYRALVRKLHPDAQSEATPQQLERWHQVQEAYQANDAEQLEVLLALCEIEEKGTKNVGSVSLLARITRQLKSSLRQIRSQLTKCRRDPAWKFSRRSVSQMRDLKGQTERYLEDGLEQVESELHFLEQRLARWATPRRRKRRAPPRRRKVASRQEEFFF